MSTSRLTTSTDPTRALETHWPTEKYSRIRPDDLVIDRRKNLPKPLISINYQTKQKEHRVIEFSQLNNTLFTIVFDDTNRFIRRVLSIDIKIKQGDGIVTFADLEEEDKKIILKGIKDNILTSNDIKEGSDEDTQFFLILDFSGKDLSTDEELGEDVVFRMDSEIPQEVYSQVPLYMESTKMCVDTINDTKSDGDEEIFEPYRFSQESPIFRATSSVESSGSSSGR